MRHWVILLYPELEQLPESQRDRFWRLANAKPFLPAEFILILAAVAAAALVVRYAGFRAFFGNPLLGFAADFVAAGVVLILIAGPIYWRRAKRGLAEAMRERPLL